MEAALSHPTEPGDHASAQGLPLERILEQVRSYWGFEKLRPLQEEAIRATLEGRDSVVVMPTGGGKSLCYQVPPLLTGRTHIVISPMISLMKDQVDGLRACGYPAAAIHSGLSHDENDRTIDELRAGRFLLLFVSPERLLTQTFLGLVDQFGVQAFAIDEAHCISHWGHDFRPEYRKLAILKQRFPKAGVHAYTATATQRVREDIAAQLQLGHSPSSHPESAARRGVSNGETPRGLKPSAQNTRTGNALADPAMLVGTFDRPNLVYRVVPRVDIYSQVAGALGRHKGEGAIVYCLSRKDTEAMAGALQAAGIDARAYHAGLDRDERRDTQDAFARESLNVVTATVAFGMGIDRSNVRCVVHATMPKSVEHFQQETGRAGRDGLEADCVLFYSASDVMRWQSLIARSAKDAADPEQFIAAQTALLEEMRRYSTAPKCRHRTLSEHFGQAYAKENCEACDVCLHETEDLEGATEIAQKILSCVVRIERASGTNFGAKHVVDVLLGANTDSIRRMGHADLSTYGLLRGIPQKTLMNLVFQLVDQELVTRTAGDRPVLTLNNASWEVMRGQRPARLIRPAEEPSRKTRGTVESWEGVDRDLFEHLRGVRRELAVRDAVPAFVIFTDRTLRDLARRRPTCREALQQVHGVGEAKLAKFGDRFLSEIDAYCRPHELPTDVVVHDTPGSSDTGVSAAMAKRMKQAAGKASGAKQAALDMFAKGASLEDVAAAVGRVGSTVANYLAEYIETTEPATIDKWVSDTTYNAVAYAADEVGTNRLKPIFERLEGKVPYDEIRLVVSHLRIRGD